MLTAHSRVLHESGMSQANAVCLHRLDSLSQSPAAFPGSLPRAPCIRRCNCPCWSLWEASSQHLCRGLQKPLPSCRAPHTPARTRHYLRLPGRPSASPQPCVGKGPNHFLGTCRQPHLACKFVGCVVVVSLTEPRRRPWALYPTSGSRNSHRLRCGVVLIHLPKSGNPVWGSPKGGSFFALVI